ncbi:hypothetical protein HD600_001840 [Microbacterium ginsengiterrae]|uniref:DUF1877 family protein n=1 Tax=Microbacterium ginsengiterrae TaxID=546115 RepID=A0A7W9CD79_9MICO|nr:hypothetical protein [Microbacterium ginsengiterrae]MBB5743343.1 hypothetical protein [Microbacterium ginsengiterrae]
MGIRYYAYAFDADLAQQAVHDPRSIVSSDPLADAWGMEPHASVGIATFLHRAQAFVETLTANGRGMVYLIG